MPLRAGVKNVATEMDERILSVTVVGDFDAKMLRDFVAKKTKKEVDLVGDGERERDDHQVLEKTGKDSKNIGGGKLVGGNKNKKRVVVCTIFNSSCPACFVPLFMILCFMLFMGLDQSHELTQT